MTEVDSLVIAAQKLKASDKRMYIEAMNRILTDRNDYLEEILHDLDLLMQYGEYDDEYRKPSDEIASQMRDLIRHASEFVTGYFPLGTIYADGSGGLRLEWIRSNCELRLVLPQCSESAAYLYHEREDDYGAEYDVTPQKLGERINWLNQYAG